MGRGSSSRTIVALVIAVAPISGRRIQTARLSPGLPTTTSTISSPPGRPMVSGSCIRDEPSAPTLTSCEFARTGLAPWLLPSRFTAEDSSRAGGRVSAEREVTRAVEPPARAADRNRSRPTLDLLQPPGSQPPDLGRPLGISHALGQEPLNGPAV